MNLKLLQIILEAMLKKKFNSSTLHFHTSDASSRFAQYVVIILAED